jgi:hypothetical protein
MKFKRWLLGTVYDVRARRNRDVGQRVRAALAHLTDEITCFIVCYNHTSHVERMVTQLNPMGINPTILDNASTCA